MLIVGLALSRYGQYTWQYFTPALPTIRSHSPGIYGAWITVALAGAIWLLAPWRPVRSAWARGFLVATLLAWVVRIGIARFHGDMVDLNIWLYPTVLVLLWLKFPDLYGWRAALATLGWTSSLLLIWTRTSELLGWIPMAPVSPNLVAFEVAEYWLPLSGWLGPEGRWPGPLGGTAYTGALGALLLVLAFALRTKSSWFFGAVGAIVLLLTSSRGAIAGAGAGVAIAVLFSNWRLLNRLTFTVRALLASLGGLVVMAIMVSTNVTLTGRTSFWLDFLDLWRQSPILGVGTSGYLEGTEATAISGTAHSFYIDELARNGLFGFIVLLASFAIAAVLGLKAAHLHAPGPLALFAAVAVLGLVNTPFPWLSPSLMWFFYVLPVLWASAIVSVSGGTSPQQSRASN